MMFNFWDTEAGLPGSFDQREPIKNEALASLSDLTGPVGAVIGPKLEFDGSIYDGA